MTLSTLKTFRRATGLVVVTAMVCLAGAAVFHSSGTNRDLGSVSRLNQPLVSISSTHSGKGYWLAAADGGVFTFGDASFYGSTGNLALAAPIIDITPTPSGKGYWLAASDGGVFTFGDAHFFGSTGDRRLVAPIVGIATTRTGKGYWLVASDGGIFTFGDARFYGSAGGRRLAAPIVGIARTRSGKGYWLATSNGAVYPFGDARSMKQVGNSVTAPVVGISRQNAGNGYWLAAADGSTAAFGKARPLSTAFGKSSAGSDSDPVVTMTSSPKGGYWVATAHGTVGVSTKQIAAPKVAKPSAKATSSIAYQLFQRMNAERRARRMTQVGWDPLLAQRATVWARVLLATNQFKHQDLGTIANAAAGRFGEIGENLFSGTGGAADAGTAHVALMQSPDHRANVLLPQGQLVGIAAVCSGGKLMVVEDFAIKMGSPMPPAGQGIPAQYPIAAPGEGGAGC